jgi:hypothetical protein
LDFGTRQTHLAFWILAHAKPTSQKIKEQKRKYWVPRFCVFSNGFFESGLEFLMSDSMEAFSRALDWIKK